MPIHGTSDRTLQPHPDGAVTLAEPEPPPQRDVTEAGETLNEQVTSEVVVVLDAVVVVLDVVEVVLGVVVVVTDVDVVESLVVVVELDGIVVVELMELE